MATTYKQRQYTESDSVKKLRDQMTAQTSQKPADYDSQYRPQIDNTVNSILNRKPFQYDLNGDALYQQYKDRYVNLGQQAMMDTMGQAAKLTGGYGNSNAQMVGQQAYQSYLQGLTDKIPELYQMAYDQYNQQGQDLYQQYGLLSEQDKAAYDRWNANYSRWLTERDYLTGRYDTDRAFDYGQFADDRNFGYQLDRDKVSDDQWKALYDQDAQQWQAQYDEGVRQWQAQFDEDLRRFNFANKLGEFAPVLSTGGGGYYDDGHSNGTPIPKPEETTSLIMEAAQAAKQDGAGAAIDWVNSQSNVSREEKNAAIQNAMGAAMTEYYKNRVKK